MRRHTAIFPIGVTFVALLLLLAGCGYLPSSKYARSVVGSAVSTNVIISQQDPENTVIIKDAVDAAVMMRFRASLVDRASSTTHLDINLGNVTFTPLQYDANGYIIAYRTVVNLTITRTTKVAGQPDEKRTYPVMGLYDFAIQPQAIISEQARFDAIKSGAGKAIDSFVARVASEGAGRSSKP